MRNFLKAFRKARIYAAQYGGGKVFWDEWPSRPCWKAIPIPPEPSSNEIIDIIREDVYPNYLKKYKP